MPDLRPFHHVQVTTQLLSTQHLKRTPAWLATVIRVPPKSNFARVLQPIKGPSSRAQAGKVRRIFEPQQIRYREDYLRQRFYKQHPWELARPILLVEDERIDTHDWSTGIRQPGRRVTGESVIQRQIYLMSQMQSEDSAYLQACQEFYRDREATAIEDRVAHEEALAFGTQFHESQLEVGLDLERRVVDKWRVKALAASTLAQTITTSPTASAMSTEKDSNDVLSTLL